MLRRNTMVNNGKYQLLSLKSVYSSEDNCFEPRGPEQLVADFVFTEHYRTLADYQQGKRQDLHSREARCGPLPPKVDVHALHRETVAYTERARRILRGELPADAPPRPAARGWLDWLLGR